ncbi:AAA family ATPase [Rhizobium lentis]|uniref:DNA repair exonuclease SbcCD ATPase subunit n=1 Tax=Rhizobium binae TaxID=1138190 RepID=A0ABV2MS92_9HYPH|nr:MULTISPECIES: AAA family ATPase [Rhizobium]NKL52758.1 AAA family ATPase [Rhizobium leguminosarum bv. viciae]MBX4927148.1 AAA family ATPase [Rhizobium binae]MBX4996121.1 AAA family ATPase [Rhizobium binae]MBX5082633.1 AAA family ATPase [Rhizobium lentis]MBX5096226.1 AAA family ATPase [Rhizobium lentis]
MSNVYLNRIRLEQYRTFKTLDIELPDGPGVLVVHGSNGIGKSSMFDGLEWALTDKIDHFRDADGVKKVGSYLCRWNQDSPGPTSVTLEFTGGNSLSRTLSSSRATKSTVAGTIPDIAEYLRDKAWDRNISELSSYLLLTHFLGQSTKSRLTNREPGERFDILKEAAQSKQVEEIAKALHGKGNTKASRAFSDRIGELNKDVSTLQNLLDTEASLWSGLTSVSALSDDTSTQLAQTISQLLYEATGTTQTALVTAFDEGTIGVLETRLHGLRDEMRILTTRITSGNETLASWEKTSRQLSELEAAQTAINAQIAALAVKRHELEEALSRLKDGEDASRLAAKNARDRRDRLMGLKDALQSAALLVQKKGTADANVASARSKLEDESRRLSSLERRLQIVRRIEGDVGRLDERIKLTQTERENVSTWITRGARIAEMRSSVEALEASAPNLDDDISGASQELVSFDELVEGQEKILADLRSTVNAMSSAVASVAANLTHESCDCPVCATHFKTEGELQRRAAGAAERLAPLALAQETQLIGLTRQRDAAKDRLSQLRGLEKQRNDLNDTRRSEEHANRDLAASVFGADLTADNETARLRHERLEKNAAEMAWLRQRKWYWRNKLSGTLYEPGGDHAATVRRRDQAQIEVSTANQGQDVAAKELASITASVALYDQALGTNAPRGDRLDEALAAAEDDLSTKEAVSKQAASDREAVEQDLASLDVAASAAAVRKQQGAELIDAAVQGKNEAVAAWRRLIIEGSDEPDAELLKVLTERSMRLREKLSEAEDLLKQLRDGRMAKTLAENHVVALESLRAAINGAPNSDRSQLRAEAHAAIDAKSRAADATQEAKDIAHAASSEILDEVAEFNANYMKPLGTLMKSISRAILCDPRVGIDQHVRNRRVEQSATKDGEVPTEVGQIDPILVHSEGQMAALSVSMLCAASLTYPWSRWRGLVLDDPLQHNDAIHAAAFADFVCNLVADRKYQVLLSTHDRAQAEFVRRKVASRGLPCGMLSLQGVGQDGVEWNYNPAVGASSLTVFQTR